MRHALFQRDRLAGWEASWLATHPPLSLRIERLLGEAAAPMVAERGPDDLALLSIDQSRAAAWLTLSALPALVYVAEATFASDPADRSACCDCERGREDKERRPRRARRREPRQQQRSGDDRPCWWSAAPSMWKSGRFGGARRPAARSEQAARLRRLGPQAVEGLRWPLMELCAAAIKPLARPWKEDLLRMLRGQIEIDQRVTLAEWIYYMLLRARLLPGGRRLAARRRGGGQCGRSGPVGDGAARPLHR